MQPPVRAAGRSVVRDEPRPPPACRSSAGRSSRRCRNRPADRALEGLRLVLVLRAAFLGDDDQPGGRVPKAHRGAGLVALLPAGPAGAVGVHLALGEQLVLREPRPGRARQALGGWVGVEDISVCLVAHHAVSRTKAAGVLSAARRAGIGIARIGAGFAATLVTAGARRRNSAGGFGPAVARAGRSRPGCRWSWFELERRQFERLRLTRGQRVAGGPLGRGGVGATDAAIRACPHRDGHIANLASIAVPDHRLRAGWCILADHLPIPDKEAECHRLRAPSPDGAEPRIPPTFTGSGPRFTVIVSRLRIAPPTMLGGRRLPQPRPSGR